MGTFDSKGFLDCKFCVTNLIFRRYNLQYALLLTYLSFESLKQQSGDRRYQNNAEVEICLREWLRILETLAYRNGVVNLESARIEEMNSCARRSS